MTEHQGLPVKGYTGQGEEKINYVNDNKVLEERIMRRLDYMMGNLNFDARMSNIARTQMQEAFMWMNRAAFQPMRVKLPEDEV